MFFEMGSVYKGLTRLLWLLVLLPVALVLLGMGCVIMVETSEASLAPLLRTLAGNCFVQVDAEVPVNPELEGRVVEVRSAPVSGCDVLTDPDFGISCRSMFLCRTFRRTDGKRGEITGPLSKYHFSGTCYSDICRVGKFRVLGQDADALLWGEQLDLPGTQDRQKLRIPQELQSLYVEGTYPPRFRLPDGGEAELSYFCQPEGSTTYFQGTQYGDGLFFDDEARAILYCRQWGYSSSELWSLSGIVVMAVVSTLPMFWAVVLLVQFALRGATGGRSLYAVPLYIPALLLWLGLWCVAGAEGLRSGACPCCLEVAVVAGYAVGALCLILLAALIWVRPTKAPRLTL